MKRAFAFIAILVLVAAGVWFWQNRHGEEISFPEVSGLMEIKSSAFEHNGEIPSKYTCDGENINPPLSIADVPEGAKSLVLVVEDPDAPSGTFTHWTVWNISPQAMEISENSVPEEAVEGKTDFGKVGYGGPCPPSGTHRYFFKAYALDTTLDLARGAAKSELTQAVEGHVLGSAELIGLFAR